ncbi:MAG TPA: carbohydrate kinase family protein [Solirubrobacteraceae bacterium]|nr:carbohydrate kinase family protein [Solirubrobacteraceae bacterium]
MTGATFEKPPPGAPTLCLGDPIVEFVCERPVASVSDADTFVPYVGGVVANVAVAAARRGAHVAVAGAAGDDAWGFWLRERLGRESIETEWFDLVPGAQTPVATVTVDVDGEASREVYGERVAPALGEDRLEEAVRGSAALYITSGGPEDNEVTMRAREHALSLERPVVFDPQICVERWRSRAEAAAAANACVPDALLVCASEADAALMTGEDDPERAALALLKAGARMVVITLGSSEGAILRGELRLDVDGVPVTMVSAIGAGEVLTGVLLARLAASAFYPSAVAASLPEAVAESARACERWGALE